MFLLHKREGKDKIIRGKKERGSTPACPACRQAGQAGTMIDVATG